MSRSQWALVGVLLLVHLLVLVLLPGGDRLDDQEIKALTGGLRSMGELIPAIKSGAIPPHPLASWLLPGILGRLTRNPWILHIPGMLMSLLAIVVIVRIGYRHLSTHAGLIAASVYAVSLPMATLGRRLGPESGFLLLNLLALHFFLSGWRRIGRRPWSYYLASLIGLLYWHYYGLTVVLLHVLLFCTAILWWEKLHRSRKPGRPPIGETALCLGVALVIYAPWFFLVTIATHSPAAPSSLGAAQFYGHFARQMGFGGYLGAAIVGIFSLVGLIRGLQEERVTLPAGKLFISAKSKLPTLLIVMSCILYVPSLFVFHRATATSPCLGGISAIIPFLLLLVGIGVTRSAVWWRTEALAPRIAIVVGISCVLSLIGWQGPSASDRSRTQTWGHVVSHLTGRVRQGDLVLVRPEDAQAFLLWAASDQPWLHLIRGEEWLSRHDAALNFDRISTIWICDRQEPQPGFDEVVRVGMLVKVGGLDLGVESAGPYYIHNVDRKFETNPNRKQPFTYSWALDTHSKLNFPLESNRDANLLILRAMPYSAPQRLTVDLNKRRILSLDMREGWHHYIHAFQPQWLPGNQARFDFRTTTCRPFFSPDGTPQRMKAVAFDYVAVFSTQSEVIFPEELHKMEKEAEVETKRPDPRSIQRRKRG